MPKPASFPFRASLCLLALGLYLPAHAERTDRSKPIQAESDRLTLDNAQKTSVFEGNVLITQGSLRITAERVVLREEKDGSRRASGVGHPTTFRQKRDDVDEYVDGSADRLEFDGRNDRIELFGHATLRRGGDDIRGEYISYDTRTEFFRVNSSAGPTGGPPPGGGRVHVTIQPAASDTAPAVKRDAPAGTRP